MKLEQNQDPYGGAEAPRGLDTADMVLLIQRAMREMQIQPQVNYQQNGYKLASILLGILVTISIGISAWTLNTVVTLKSQVDVLQCQVSDACKHAVMRGAP